MSSNENTNEHFRANLPDYEPAGFALEIFKSRYAMNPDESWNEACERLSSIMSVTEQSVEKKKDSYFAFKEILTKNLFMPGGRIWHSAGRPKGNLMNCFVVPTEDSRNGWAKAFSDTLITTGMGGGVGLNFAAIRPKGSPIVGTGGVAGGPCGLMHIINAIGDVVRASGGRRPALMMCLDLDHPDIIEFLDKKLDLSQLNNANISVVIPYGKQDLFIQAVKNDLEWNLEWEGKVYSTVRAKELWDRLVKNALNSAEPGILNGHFANKMNNIHYYKPLISTNPCAEQWLEAYGACDLGALVLPRFVVNGKFNWQLLGKTISYAVRFLDNVIDVSHYPVPEAENEMKSVRRIGLGVLGLHHMLLELGYKYSSQEGIEFIDMLFSFIRDTSYVASIELAREKGPFPQFDADGFLASGYVKQLSEQIRKSIADVGIRNCAVLTIPPTGTTSIVCGVSSGVEPIYAMAYERKYRSGEEMKTEVVYDSMMQKFLDEGRDTFILESAMDLSVRSHLEIQRICQKYVDSAVSKTINISATYDFDEVSALMLEYLPHVKGVTVYVDGSRGESPLSKPMSVEDVLKNYCPKGQCAI